MSDVDVENMTDRELLEETVKTLRETRKLVEGFIANFSKSPMFGMVNKMFGSK